MQVVKSSRDMMDAVVGAAACLNSVPCAAKIHINRQGLPLVEIIAGSRCVAFLVEPGHDYISEGLLIEQFEVEFPGIPVELCD